MSHDGAGWIGLFPSRHVDDRHLPAGRAIAGHVAVARYRLGLLLLRLLLLRLLLFRLLLCVLLGRRRRRPDAHDLGVFAGFSSLEYNVIRVHVARHRQRSLGRVHFDLIYPCVHKLPSGLTIDHHPCTCSRHLMMWRRDTKINRKNEHFLDSSIRSNSKMHWRRNCSQIE